MMWKVCITWATLLRQIHRTFAAAMRTTVRHTCKGQAVEKRNFVIVISSFQGSSATPLPHHQNNCGSIIFIPAVRRIPLLTSRI